MAGARKATTKRRTRETEIRATIAIDGKGEASVDTGVGFAHHTIEDCGWALGEAFAKALGDGAGIRRYASFHLPMDECLSRAAVDISGRPFLVWRVELSSPDLGGMQTETLPEFFQAFSQAAGITLHIENLYGSNTHHVVESFKALARALREAVTVDPGEKGRVPSTKGVLGGSL